MLCLVLDRATARGDLCAIVAAAVRGGVDWVQIRDRELPGSPLLDHADAVIRSARTAAADCGRDVRALVNRRVDVALAAGADGVHLGFDGMPPETARSLLGADAWIGASTHAAAEIPPLAGRVHYVHLAPVFAPLSKASTRPALGTPALGEAAAHAVPVIAQGGIDAPTARAARAAGAAGVAVTGAILHADDPERAAAALREALDA